MNYRISEIEELNLDARWLSKEHAKNTYEYALQFSSSNRYGLSEATVNEIERLEIESYSVAENWVISHLESTGKVHIVFGEEEVIVLPTDQFLLNWHRIFVPSRDDAVILHSESKGIMFYCHEQEIEFGYRAS
ncbi:hypothetical protein [Undibacterium sp. Di24W]|uniref:hypothetical protein n=1 Tax=Undibacterium sp. Di24W TaxID=3413033 RepID=UPI003BF2509C